MKTMILGIAAVLSFSVSANAAICASKGGQKAVDAYKGQVEAALVEDNLDPVPRTSIDLRITDAHDAEFTVRLSDGSLRAGSCDDSGDDQCQCGFDNEN